MVGICVSGLHVVSGTASGLGRLQPDLCLIFSCLLTYGWMGKSSQCWLQLCLQFWEGGGMPSTLAPTWVQATFSNQTLWESPVLWGFDVLDYSVLSCTPRPPPIFALPISFILLFSPLFHGTFHLLILLQFIHKSLLIHVQMLSEKGHINLKVWMLPYWQRWGHI